jgi:hypothetical protein
MAPRNDDPHAIRKLAHRIDRRHVLAVLVAVVFLVQFGLSLGDLPTTKIAQDVVCLQTFADGGLSGEPGRLPEALCRGDTVQGRLNAVMVGLAVSQTIGSMHPPSPPRSP